MKIYFAHPVSDYGKLREAETLSQIQINFPFAEILNPNQKTHNDAYLIHGMSYFEELVQSCDILVAVPFKDGEWGMGVWREAEALAKKGGKVYQLFNNEITEVDFKDIRPLSITETRKRVKEGDLSDIRPTLNVYTNQDGSLYSKIREVKSVLNWIRAKSR